MIIFNLKTYPTTTGKMFVETAEDIIQAISDIPAIQDHVYVCPTQTDLSKAVLDFPELNIIAQHVDFMSSGKTTGWTPVEVLKDLGVEMTLLNHSEHRAASIELLKEHVKFVQNSGIKVLVCCENINEAELLLEAEPYAISYEPAHLIGTGKSLTREMPEAVTEFVDLVKNKALPIIGAGIADGEDVKAGVELGGKGFLIASRFAKADDKVSKTKEFVSVYTD
ncbi:triose-phosphate isomerase [Candidatus Dojkabacteria bacterium]|nr:triose-phosphate isomerase [Candidatus Dojkabacteria bacterium]